MQEPGAKPRNGPARQRVARTTKQAPRESHLISVLRAIRDVNQLIVHENDPHRLIDSACQSLTGTLGYHNAWIALLDGEGQPAFATAAAGFDDQFNAMRERLAHGELSACARRALESDATIVVSDPVAECSGCPLAREYAGRARLTRRLAFEGTTYGLLAASVPAEYAVDAEEQSLFDEVATDLSFALHKINLEATLKEVDNRVRATLNAVLSPEGDLGELALADVLDVPAIQRMMDDFYGLTGMGMAILDIQGDVLVAVGWQDICTKFHRVHPETRRHCVESDTELSSGVAPGSFRVYRCKNNLWDIATPIMVGGRHAGNLFVGQFIFEDEAPDREVFREQARRYGFDEAAYLAALDRLPRWSRERVNQAMAFFAAFARQLSDLSFGNVKLARTLAQRDELLGRLGQNEERLRLALRATNDVVWDWDVVNDSQRWNESGTDVFGWTDIVEAPQTASWWIDRVHPEDRQRVSDGFYAAVADPVVDRWRDEYRFRRADGANSYVVDRGHILRDADGHAVRMIGAMLDITERRQAEEALQHSRRLLTATEALSAVGGWEWDVTAQVMTWTDGTYRIHDLDPPVLPAGSPEHIERSLACYDPDDRPRIAEAFRRCVEEGAGYDLECGFTTAAGRRLRVRTMGRAVRENGRIVKVLGNLQDITEQKRVEEEREKLQAQLLQAQKMESVGRLAGGVAHDFNNILQAQMGNGHLLVDALPPDSEAREFAMEILQGVDRAAALTRQLLAFARKQTIRPQVLDLNGAVDSMLKMLRRLLGEDLAVVWQPDARLWPVKVDPGQVDQILANLCVNARDAVQGVGTVTIETANVTLDEVYRAHHSGVPPGDFVMLVVSDDGAGMDRETCERVFEPFFTTKATHEGTGLGLATVYGIVKQNDGSVNVYSELGVGTTFRIYLPRYVGDAEPVAPAVDSDRWRGSGETVLLVEDDQALLRVGQRMLEGLGYDVRAAKTPGEALELATELKEQVSLLITDVIMPQMSGPDLAAAVRRLCPQVRILFMSGYTANVIAHRGVLDEGVNFIEKPFSARAFGARIRQALDG